MQFCSWKCRKTAMNDVPVSGNFTVLNIDSF